MEKKKNYSMHKMMFLSVVYFLSAFMLLSVSVYAWFIITNTNHTHLISNITDVEAEYEFYVYQNKLHDGSENLTLENNVCTDLGQDLCYKFIPNPTTAYMMEQSIAPGERFSFAVKVVALGNSESYFNLSLGGVQSFGYDLPQNRIQNAFWYEVTKISYIINDEETTDYKENEPIAYSNGYFNKELNHIYPLVSNIPIFIDQSLSASIIVYFDFYFDPTIYGSDFDFVPYTNSNIFINQAFTV
ncbi:MAG: hypothetical protein Q7I99_02945, partial [Acholeplasmataceae bacterium]|nr:hypothetical protein [Acholeplasmataceae bacterium]